jgi:hypothetical protein
MSSCEKYGDWMRDAALGALAQRRERELLAHVGECDACREAYELGCELVALVDHGVESLVAGEPSPHFDSRLRARIAEEPSAARSAWFTWRPAAAALALAALIAAVVFFRGSPQQANPRPTSALIRPESTAKASPSALNEPSPRSHASAERPMVAASGDSHRQLVAGHAPPRHEPEVIVPPGQLEAIMQLAAEIRFGRIDGEQLVAADAQIKKPLDIAPIEIAPLEKPQSDVDAPAAPADSRHP